MTDFTFVSECESHKKNIFIKALKILLQGGLNFAEFAEIPSKTYATSRFLAKILRVPISPNVPILPNVPISPNVFRFISQITF
jgi:hypothetical protein